MSFARRLKAMMRERDISASQLARLVGVSGMAVSNWRNGTIPRPEKLARIAQVLGVNPQFLMNGIAEETAPTRTRTVGEIIDEAQREIARISGLPLDRVKVKIEYLSD